MPDAGLALIVLGGLWLCLWRRPWRWAALLPILLGALSPLTFEPPHLLVSDDARQVAVRDGEESSCGGPSGAGRLWVASRRTDRFVLEPWARPAYVAGTIPWRSEARRRGKGDIRSGRYWLSTYTLQKKTKP